MQAKLFCAALFLSCLPAVAQTPDVPRPPEFVAEQKAKRLYRYFLDGMMRSPEFNGHNLTFRIQNSIFTGGDGKHPEFYLMAVLHLDYVEIRYLEKKSIFTSVYEYFLANPGVTIDELNYWPDFVHKRINYQTCPELKGPIYAVENHIRTSLISPAQYEHSPLSYLVGYAKDSYDVTFEVRGKDTKPVAELLEIKDIAMRCARDLPTVAEVDKAEQLERERQHEEIRRNFKGVLYDSPFPIVLTHRSRKYGSGIGTSCWGIGREKFCDDVFAHVTPRVPIVVRKGDRVSFEIPERGRLDSMDFSITRVTSNDIRKNESDKEFPGIIIWEKQTRDRPMTGGQLDSLVIDKPPGNYILVMYGVWKDYGDAAHGFYLKVMP